MSVTEYRRDGRPSYSSLKLMFDSPQHYKERQEVKETRPMLLGKLLDEAVLSWIQPKIIEIPEQHRKPTGEGSKKARAAWMAEQAAKGLEPVTTEEHASIFGMWNALVRNPLVRRILQACPERQKEVFANVRGVDVKCLLDLAGHDTDGRRLIWDLKTARSADPREFGRQASLMGYDFQLCLYAEALGVAEGLEEPPLTGWIVAENSHPYAVSVFMTPEAAIASGTRKVEACLSKYAECQRTGIWPGYQADSEGFSELEWPRWGQFNTNTEEV